MGVEINIGFNKFPEQGKLLGKRVAVYFNFDDYHPSVGTVVRYDVDEPYRTIVALEDGRYILGNECHINLMKNQRKWMKEKPKAVGFYFYRKIDEDRPDLQPSIIEIYYSILDMMRGDKNPEKYYRRFGENPEPYEFIDFEDYEWYGPLKPPMESEGG
jgi:hypothetical protein